MAAVGATADMTIQKNSEILVKVDEALQDLLVVSYCSEDKNYQGVLLDSTKGNLPFGVYSLHPAFVKQSVSSETPDEKLHSASQRFTYQEPQFCTRPPEAARKVGSKGKAQQKQKMTVRLRPRKVLCSNCQGICNENNESVVVKKRKHEDPNSDNLNHDAEKKFLMGSRLIPKLSRLHPNEISNAIKGSKTKSDHTEPNKSDFNMIAEESHFDNDGSKIQELAFINVNEDINMNCHETTKDESFSTIFNNAKTLKICFGEGEGTVVKIPQMENYNEDSGVCDMSKQTKQSDTKAAKKALKRARKEAKKNEITAVTSLRSKVSPKHVGALSPRNNVDDTPMEKKHRHKVKHKKKHRLAKERDENASKSCDDESVNYFGDIKDNCLKQKLSINLRRLSSNSYEKCDQGESESDWEGDTVPDFPPNGTEGAVDKALCVSPGDIVWGKVVGFPWWPGRVLSVTPTSKAHVSWFASTTSSLMPCDSLCPFLEDYKLRFNKKKKGSYKEAVKQATIEAKKVESQVQDPLASPTHTLATASPRPINVFS